MTIVLIVLSAILGLAAVGSASQKLRSAPSIVAAMHEVGVSDRQIPLLALVEILGALGLLVGIWVVPIGVAAAAGLTLYFLGAVAAHVRVKAPMKDLLPAVGLMLLALVTTLLQWAR